jgi:hypothetical protein
MYGRYDSLDGGPAHHKTSTYTQNNTNRINVHRFLMPREGFEPMISVCERAKAVYAPDLSSTVIGDIETYITKILVFATTLFDQIPKFMEQRFSFHGLDSGSL